MTGDYIAIAIGVAIIAGTAGFCFGSLPPEGRVILARELGKVLAISAAFLAVSLILKGLPT